MKGAIMSHADRPGDRIAGEFRRGTPALSRLVGGKAPVFMDAPGGSQMPGCVMQAMADYIQRGMANRHGAFETSIETEAVLARARQQVSDLLNADGYDIVFGQNMTSLAFALATSLARDWATGGRRSEVVVSEIDHHANVDPWRSVASDKGMDVRWLPVETERVTLDLDQLDAVVTDRCAVTAVSLASNAVGTIQDAGRIARRAREMGGITVVDAVHAVPHVPVDLAGLGADVLFCSAYKFFGPHIGIMAIRRELLERVRFYKVAPAPGTGPDKAELGSQNHEAAAGLCAALDFIAALGEGSTARERFASAMRAIGAYEDTLAATLAQGLAAMPGVTVFRAPNGTARTPTIAFTAATASPAQVASACGEQAVFVTNGDFYATTLARRMGVAESGGWIRAGLAPYIGPAEVDRALTVIEQAIGAPPTRRGA
jgi:cysteine desulfurase family protein (TIGR01976 family)